MPSHGGEIIQLEAEMLRFDNGGEFKSEQFVRCCRQHDIRREYTTPYSLEQNDVAEQMNRTIQERIVAMTQHIEL